MRRAVFALVLLVQAAWGQPLFTFRNDFTVNLHHFLYVLGRARAGSPDSKREAVRRAPEEVAGLDALDKAQLLAWDGAIEYYRQTLSRKDAVFDKDLVGITRALAEGDAAPPELRAVLERAAPVYRRVWWAQHEQGNRERIAELEVLLRKHGAAITAAVTRLWGQQWPESGRVVQVSGYANWAGAYSTDGGLIVIGSRNPETMGTDGLEILFHEAMHQWDEDFEKRLERAAAVAHITVPRALSHSLIFFTAGWIVAKECAGHRPYADANGLWERGMFSRERIEAEWAPYLQGKRSMEDALAGLLAR